MQTIKTVLWTLAIIFVLNHFWLLIFAALFLWIYIGNKIRQYDTENGHETVPKVISSIFGPFTYFIFLCYGFENYKENLDADIKNFVDRFTNGYSIKFRSPIQFVKEGNGENREVVS